MSDELARCLRELAAQGHTVFCSSHSLCEVEQLYHRVAVVRAGRVVANESADSLRCPGCTESAAAFHGDYVVID